MTSAAPANRSLAGRAGLPILILLIASAVVQTMSHLVPELLRDDLYSGDAQQHVWWMYRFINPALFPNDSVASYYSLFVYSTPGYQVVMRVLIRLMDPQHAAETLAIILALLAIGLTAWLGGRIGKKVGAAAALAAFILCRCDKLVEGGYPRSFALLLLLAGIFATCRRRWAMLGLVLAITPLLYPPMVLNLAPAVALVLLWGIYKHRRLPHGFTALAVLSGIAVASIVAIYLRPLPAAVGPWFTYAEARKLPEWRPGGRTAFFHSAETFYYTNTMSGIGMTKHQAMLAAAIVLIAFLWRPRAVPLAGWGLLLGSLAMFGVAHSLLFKLYLPSRYTSTALPVFAIVAAAAYAREIKIAILARRRVWSCFVRPGVAIVACAFSVVVCRSAVQDVAAAMTSPPYGDISLGFEPVLVYLRTLPVDTLIAAHPNDANAIPLRAQRSVLANTETTIAFNKAYYLRMRKRLSATFAMLYAPDWATVDRVAAEQGVQIFVLDRQRLTHPDDQPYFKPFRGANATMIEAGKASGFAMLTPPADRVLFQSGDWVVLRVSGGKP